MFWNERGTAGGTRGRTLRHAGGALAALAVLAAGCDLAEASSHQDEQRQGYDQRITRIELDVDSGDIVLRAAGGDDGVDVERQLEWSSSKPTVSEQWDGETLRISTDCPDQRRCSVDYEIGLPAAVSVVAKTDAGDITTEGITGPQEVTSNAGDLALIDPQGELSLSTDAGQITASGVSAGQVAARTDAGNIELELVASPDEVRAETSAGDIEVRVPRADAGYQVETSTSVGEERVEVATDPASPHRLVLTTDAGDVRVEYA